MPVVVRIAGLHGKARISAGSSAGLLLFSIFARPVLENSTVLFSTQCPSAGDPLSACTSSIHSSSTVLDLDLVVVRIGLPRMMGRGADES